MTLFHIAIFNGTDMAHLLLGEVTQSLKPLSEAPSLSIMLIHAMSVLIGL